MSTLSKTIDPRAFEIPIKRTWILPVCWVCRKTMLDSGGTDPSIIRHEHHVIPRACGGTNGPQITLCSAHHNLLHAIAENVLANNEYESKVKHLTKQEHKSIIYLVGVVVTSMRAVENDTNKRGQISLTFPGEVNQMMKQLTKLHGCSQAKLVESLIRQEYARRIPSK